MVPEERPEQRPVRAERRPVNEHDSLTANRADWDRYADEYQATHGEFLGDAGFLWGPEGVREDGILTTGGPQQGDEDKFPQWFATYDKVLITRETDAKAKTPGPAVLEGTLPSGA